METGGTGSGGGGTAPSARTPFSDGDDGSGGGGGNGCGSPFIFEDDGEDDDVEERVTRDDGAGGEAPRARFRREDATMVGSRGCCALRESGEKVRAKELGLPWLAPMFAPGAVRRLLLLLDGTLTGLWNTGDERCCGDESDAVRQRRREVSPATSCGDLFGDEEDDERRASKRRPSAASAMEDCSMYRARVGVYVRDFKRVEHGKTCGNESCPPERELSDGF